MTGVILAAGKGKRLYPFSDDFPKTLMPVCNKTVIEYQLEVIKNLGIRDVIIVIGHFGYKIVEFLGHGERMGLNIEYIEQKVPLGIAHAVGLIEPCIKDAFLLFLGDIFFVSNRFQKFVETYRQEKLNCLLAAKYENDSDSIRRNFAIIENAEGCVIRVIEKPRYVTTNLKGCGVYIFDRHIFDAIRRTPKTAMRDEYELTDAIQILLEDGFRVKAANIIEDDLNLTCIDDLLAINLKVLKKQALPNLIGNNTLVKNSGRIINSIVGDNVYIEKDLDIMNSVVFSNVNMGAMNSSEIINSIVTTSGVYQVNNKGNGVRS